MTDKEELQMVRAGVTVTPLEWVTSDHFPSVSVAWCPLFEKNFYAEEPEDKGKVDAKRDASIRSALTVTPHDRTALDRMLRAEREKALRDVAEYVGKASNTFPDNIAWAVEDLANAILALIEQENQK